MRTLLWCFATLQLANSGSDDEVSSMEYSPLVQILILLAAVLGGLLVVIAMISVCTYVASRFRAAKRYTRFRVLDIIYIGFILPQK